MVEDAQSKIKALDNHFTRHKGSETEKQLLQERGYSVHNGADKSKRRPGE